MKHIPNFITSLNLAAGFFSVIFAFNGDLVTASWLIAAAMIFDFFDGFSARLLHTYSEIGKELDSLADMVSFGVAPAVIIYKMIEASAGINEPATAITMYLPVIMPVCAALRLARFNIDSSQKYSFKGLPTPASAIAVISVVIGAKYSGSALIGTFASSPVALDIYTVVLSLLMVTGIPLLSLKAQHLRFRGNEARYILIVLVVASFLLLGFAASPLIIPLYLLASLTGPLFFKKNSPGA